jgi:hypothetical protein
VVFFVGRVAVKLRVCYTAIIAQTVVVAVFFGLPRLAFLYADRAT